MNPPPKKNHQNTAEQ